ncbi:Peptidyl-prolyl cis-trans isomerase FKBP17-2, chloroplastic [Zea mays]|jgi:hypothetical protein|uniref:peptidylprolyl isomerase n=2 Tax=Zea mays TaxID=4577 RepID=A0A3L6ESW9_MAIZE|nr:Peptidyl-prolyl cis-trans isomerase FKBP17-2, chloroplastic [Zea mays]
MRVGGGDVPRLGDLVVTDLQGRVAGSDGEAFVDTLDDSKRLLALVMSSRPYTRGMCEGVEHVVRSMRPGGKRWVVVPPGLAFGDGGADFGEEHVQIPPGASGCHGSQTAATGGFGAEVRVFLGFAIGSVLRPLVAAGLAACGRADGRRACGRAVRGVRGGIAACGLEGGRAGWRA